MGRPKIKDEYKKQRAYYWRHRDEIRAKNSTDEVKRMRKVRAHKWYENNKRSVLKRNLERRKFMCDVINAYKDVPCTDCGKRYPYYVMDFDHVRGKKFKSLGRMNTNTLDQVLKEIDKCDVVCSNCHRERTHMRKNAVQLCVPVVAEGHISEIGGSWADLK